jgi:hypothetical protein
MWNRHVTDFPIYLFILLVFETRGHVPGTPR